MPVSIYRTVLAVGETYEGGIQISLVAVNDDEPQHASPAVLDLCRQTMCYRQPLFAVISTFAC